MNKVRFSTLWGTLGFVALLSQAIYRLAPWAIDAIKMGLTPVQWGAWVAYVLFMIYSEGYKGFHKQASPRVVARGLHLDANPNWFLTLIAPAYCMGLVYATRKRLIIAWSIVAMVVGLVIAIRYLPQPWRGIVDAGVVLGLAFGLLSTLYFLGRAVLGRAADCNPEVPKSAA